jgi:signal transduction histidine kinase
MNANDGLLLFTAAASLALGIFVFLQGPRKLPNSALSLFSASMATWCFGQFMGGVMGGKEAVLFWTRINIAGAVLIPVFYLHFVIAYIERVKENLRILFAAFFLAGLFLLLDFTPLFVADVAPRFAFRFYPVPGIVYPFFALYLAALFGLGFSKLAAFLKQSEGAKNNQAKYVFFASLIGFLGGVTAFFPVFNVDFPVLSNYSLPLYLAITVYAIAKHKLLDINLVMREGLVYSLLTFLFAGFYALSILLANRFFQDITRRNEYLTVFIVVFISVLVFQPLREIIQQWVDRLFFKGKYYYQKAISDLSAENVKLYHGLLQADKLAALGTIAAGMAHEIKNPLASIKGLTQVLPENLEDMEFIRKYSEIVPRQLDRINRIVEDLLTFGQPKDLSMQNVEIADILEEVLRLVENQCLKAEIKIEREYAKVPPILADAEKLSQAFMNVILNAVQAMPSGGVLKCRVKSTPGNVVVEIGDSGGGIPEERLPNIFDPFYTTKDKGSGMGLAVAYRIVREHAGEISVESEVGKGTVFKLCLPIEPKPSV